MVARRTLVAAIGAGAVASAAALPGAASSSRRAVAEPPRASLVPVAGRLRFFGSYGVRGSDIWVTSSISGTANDYLAANGDGFGLERSPRDEKPATMSFTRFSVLADPAGGGFTVRGTDVAALHVSLPDNYKPNALVHDQVNGDLHCFTTRAKDLQNRKRVWLLTSGLDAKSWNVADLPPLDRADLAIFDATRPGGLVPVGACNRPGGGVAPDGWTYLYLGRQGNPSSKFLYPAGDPHPDYRAFYCARVRPPSGVGDRARRHAWFKDPRNYVFRTATGWSGPGDIAAARPVLTTARYPGKNLLAWWVPRLGRYVAAYTHDFHHVWLGVADEPWGRFTTVLDSFLGVLQDPEDRIFTAQLLPAPPIEDAGGVILPLAVSGKRAYDCLVVASVRFA